MNLVKRIIPSLKFHLRRPIRKLAYYAIPEMREVMYSEVSLKSDCSDAIWWGQKLSYWHYNWLRRQNTWAKEFSPKNCYFEFGVGPWSMGTFAKTAVKFCRDFDMDINEISIVGCDSFEGLPEPEKLDAHVRWKKGQHHRTAEYIMEVIEKTGFPTKNVTLIKGFFEDSLNAENFKKIAHLSPSIINIDVDYYTSTMLAFRFIAPLLKSGAVFYFDDLWCFHGHPYLGELKAINEFNGKYGYLVPCDMFGMKGQSYIYSALDWEYQPPK